MNDASVGRTFSERCLVSPHHKRQFACVCGRGSARDTRIEVVRLLAPPVSAQILLVDSGAEVLKSTTTWPARACEARRQARALQTRRRGCRVGTAG